MKNNKIIKTLSALVMVFALTCSMSLFAGGPPPGPGTSTGTTDAIPLDGGLAILLAGAAAFGIKKLRDKK